MQCRHRVPCSLDTSRCFNIHQLVATTPTLPGALGRRRVNAQESGETPSWHRCNPAITHTEEYLQALVYPNTPTSIIHSIKAKKRYVLCTSCLLCCSRSSTWLRSLTDRRRPLKFMGMSACSLASQRPTFLSPSPDFFSPRHIQTCATTNAVYPRVVLNSPSFRVHTPDADIDVLCLAPQHCSREAFFTSFCAILHAHPEVDELFPVPEAYTPVSSSLLYILRPV